MSAWESRFFRDGRVLAQRHRNVLDNGKVSARRQVSGVGVNQKPQWPVVSCFSQVFHRHEGWCFQPKCFPQKVLSCQKGSFDSARPKDGLAALRMTRRETERMYEGVLRCAQDDTSYSVSQCAKMTLLIRLTSRPTYLTIDPCRG